MDVSEDFILDEIKDISGIDVRVLVEKGLIKSFQARKWLVKQKYYQMAKTGRTYFDIKNELSVCYDLSVSTIEKMIYRKQHTELADRRKRNIQKNEYVNLK